MNPIVAAVNKNIRPRSSAVHVGGEERRSSMGREVQKLRHSLSPGDLNGRVDPCSLCVQAAVIGRYRERNGNP